ncbi:MAG: TonB-dependent receptor, partial [Acidobacteria bacterium]|nr:TonB-dependent receptor [Acidobacteriota bacterium]
TFPGPKYDNTGDYQSSGVEAAIYANLFDIMNIYFGGCYQDTTPEDTPFAPEFSFTSGLNLYPMDNLNLNFVFQYSDEFTSGNQRTPAANILIDSYMLANLRIGYNFGEIFSGVKFTELFLYIENCFDTDYELKPGYPMPGINAHFGIKFKM